MPGTCKDTNLDTCDIWPIGTQCRQGICRSDLKMNIQCSACPDGTYANDGGLRSLNNCTLCNVGWVCASARQSFYPTSDAYIYRFIRQK